MRQISTSFFQWFQSMVGGSCHVIIGVHVQAHRRENKDLGETRPQAATSRLQVHNLKASDGKVDEGENGARKNEMGWGEEKRIIRLWKSSR